MSESLFLSAIRVCPTSAKMHQQVSTRTPSRACMRIRNRTHIDSLTCSVTPVIYLLTYSATHPATYSLTPSTTYLPSHSPHPTYPVTHSPPRWVRFGCCRTTHMPPWSISTSVGEDAVCMRVYVFVRACVRVNVCVYTCVRAYVCVGNKCG